MGEERRKSPEGLTAFEEIKILHNQFLAIGERITQHKQEQEMQFIKVNSKLDSIINQLYPHDGTDGLVQRVKNLENKEGERKEQHKTIMKIAIGSISALLLTIAAWMGKAVLFIIGLMGGK